MEGGVCCEQEEMAPIPYGELVVLGCHCLDVCNLLCIFRLEPSGRLFTHAHIFYFIYLCEYREVEADLPYSFIYCDLKDHSCTQVSLD